jgi:hypothetical protein
MANAHAALQFATQALRLPLDRIKLFGRSIGTGPTLALASKFKVAGVVLVTPFLSVRALFREKVGLLSMIVEEWFPNEDAIKEVKSPTMIIHGRKDLLIPCSHGEALYNKCQHRKLFINPQHMEHNTNLTSDISFLIVPMFRFFSLPDYSFQELKVPAWAFDKRRSPLYVRPEVQVASYKAQAASSDDGGLAGTMVLPLGDDAENEVNQDQLSGEELNSLMASATGDRVVTFDKLNVLTHPTVLHSYSATKQRYHFQETADADMRNDRGVREPPREKGEDVPVEVMQVLRPRGSAPRPTFQVERRNPLGNHVSATKPSVTQYLTGSHDTFAHARPVVRGASSGMAYARAMQPPHSDQPRLEKESPILDAPTRPWPSADDDDSDDDEMSVRSEHSTGGPHPRVPNNGPLRGPRVVSKPSPLQLGEVTPRPVSGVSLLSHEYAGAPVRSLAASASAPLLSARAAGVEVDSDSEVLEIDGL